MQGIDFFVYIIIDLFSTYILFCYLRFFNKGTIKNIKVEIGSYIAWHILAYLMANLIATPVASIVFNLIALFLLSLNYTSSIVKKFFAAAFTIIINLSVETIIVILFGSPLDEVTTNIHINLCAKILQLIIWILLSKFLDSTIKSKKTYIQWFVPIIFSITMLFIYVLLQHKYLNTSQMILSIALMTFMIISLIYVHKLDQERLKSENRLSEQKLENYNKHYSQIRSSYKRFNDIRHKWAKHYNHINTVITQNYGENEELRTYMDQILMETVEADKELIDTDNIELDSVVHARLTEAREKGIETTHKILIPDHMEVDIHDTSFALNSSFDVVMREISHLTKKKLHFVMRYNATNLYIFWVHAFDFMDARNKEEYLKRNKNHINEFRDILKRHDGDIQCFFDDMGKKVVWLIDMYAGEL